MPLGYLQEPTSRTPPSASGNMRIGVKNTFIEVMPPASEPTQRAVTTPAEMGYNGTSTPPGEMGYNGASSSMDHQNQQLQLQQHSPQHTRQSNQQQIQQQTGDARNQMNINTAYIDPATGVCQTFGMQGMPVQMVAIPYMAPGQEGYPNVQFVDPSMMPQMANNVTSDGSMQTYDFSAAQAQGAYFMPMTHAQFVPMNMGHQMPMMEVPAATNEQNGNNNFENQKYHQGQMMQSHHHNNNIAKEKRPMGGNVKSFKQKEIPSTNVHEGPKAVLVDLSKLRPVNKASGSQVRSSWYKHF